VKLFFEGVLGLEKSYSKSCAGKYRYGYQGKYAEKDEETSWQHFRRREYDPVIGRWTSVDPKRQFYSSYLGMGNNPISGFDPDGGDVIILSAPQGAGGYGHAAMLVGNDQTGWKYISKDGTGGMGGAAGPPNQSTIDAVGSPTFATLQDFLGSRFNQDQDTPSASEYHFGLQIETDEATDAMIIASAKKGALQAYDVFSDNCMQNCTRPLVEQGLLPGRFGNMVRPNRTFDDMLNHFIKNNNFDSQIFQGYHFWNNFHLIREQLPKGTIEVGPLEYKGVVKD
jgi:RHS repeat-associated protein